MMTACASHPANNTAAIVVSRRRFTVRISRPKRLAGGWLIFKLSQPSTRNPVGRAAPAKTSGTSLAVWPPVRAWDTSGSADHWDRAASSRLGLHRASDTTETASPAWRASAPTEIESPSGPAPTLPRCTCSASEPTPPSLG